MLISIYNKIIKMEKDVKCPYCGSEQDINHEDGYGYDEDVIYQQVCKECGKTFSYYTNIVMYYDVMKCDCQNGGEHKWKLSHTVPKIYSRMICSECGEERELTDDEKKRYNIK